MKPNIRNRFNNRHGGSGRNARPQIIYRNTALESTGPCGKLRGTALQLYEKYTSAGKDALIQNDDVLAEMCFQYADHYMHIQNQAIANEQAFHAQQQAQRVAAMEQNEPDENEEASDPDENLKVVDLSVPVESMNKNVELEDAGAIVTDAPTTVAPKPKRRLRMPVADKKEPQE
ncbi:MAG: DUF4167 domain-containing protein [Pseudomonadota bacterium]|nr:DUF4167 domain-containing protein [Pseudomonadota bacterium]